MEYVLQVCQFVLSLLEVGMCYKVYDLLLDKESSYRISGIIKTVMIFGVGTFLYYNRLTTCFMSNILYILKSLVMAVPMSFLYKEKYSTSLSITLSYFSVVGLLHIVCLFAVLMILKDESFYSEVYFGSGFWRIIILIVTMMLVYLIYRIIKEWKKNIILLVLTIKKYLLVISFFGCWIIAWGQTQILKLGSQWAIWSLGTLVFSLGSMAGICFMLYITMKKNMEISTIQMKSQLLSNYYEDIRTISESCLYTTHDVKNHILVLKSYVEQHDIGKIRDYLKRIGEPLDRMSQHILCGNDTVNLVVNSKLESANKKGIVVETNIDNIEYPMTDNELCSLFANLLDNAIEACEKIEDKKRWIKINIGDKDECYTIEIINSISETPKKEKKDFRSDKPGHMGYGLKSVSAIVEKHDGLMKCEFDDNSFTVKITFWKGWC